MMLSSWRSHCESSPGSFDECRLSAELATTPRPSQLTWTVSPPERNRGYRPHQPSPLLSSRGDTNFIVPRRVEGWVELALQQGCTAHAANAAYRSGGSRTLKPGPHQQQCRSNVRLCCPKRQQRRTSFALKFRPFDKLDKVECCFDELERCFDIVAKKGNIVEAIGNFFASCFENVASTLLLVWTGLYCQRFSFKFLILINLLQSIIQGFTSSARWYKRS